MENTTTPAITLNSLLGNEQIKARFAQILGKKAPSFISSIISATKANPDLAKCDPDSIIQSAVIAATLDLPIQNNLGFAAIVPYKSKGEMKAQFQIMVRGFIQLAIRTGQYQNIHASEVYEGELISHNRITGEVVIDPAKKSSEKVVGYVAYFKLLTGFEKYMYWTTEQCKAHGKKYSKSFSSEYGRWQLDFDAMAIKTVTKMLLSKYGILSVEMNTAIITDQAVIKDADTMDVEYTDHSDMTLLEPSAENTNTREDLAGNLSKLAK